MASSSESGRCSDLHISSAAPSVHSTRPVDYEEAAAEAMETVQVDAGPTDSLAEAYGRVFQWECNAFREEAPPPALLPETSVLRNQSLDERVMHMLEDLASTMHRVQLLESELSDHRNFILELHGSLLDITDQVRRHDVSRHELAEAVTSLQQRVRVFSGSGRSRSPRTPP